jgi:hypothetical protein
MGYVFCAYRNQITVRTSSLVHFPSICTAAIFQVTMCHQHISCTSENTCHIIKPRRMCLEGYITKSDTLTHNLPCLSFPVYNSTNAAQHSKQNSTFFLYYSTRLWDQKVSTLTQAKSTTQKMLQKLETKGSLQNQHRAATWCRICDSTSSLYIRRRRRTSSPICQRAAWKTKHVLTRC